jgi:replicative DNA helicase
LIPIADTGELTPILELVGHSQPFQVWALNQTTQKLELATATHVFTTGIKPVWQLTTRLGHQISATANHPFLTIHGWQRLDQLQSGQHLLDLDQSNIYWDEIKSIEFIGEQPVYDLTVPGPHNFVANNIIVHNSIEQDADLVILLYRDEYYNPDTPDRGICELILAKHRNGPVGTVKLLFDPQFTRFENLARDR